MTVQSMIAQYDMERPNKVDTSLKIQWLKRLEHHVVDTVIIPHPTGATITYDDSLQDTILKLRVRYAYGPALSDANNAARQGQITPGITYDEDTRTINLGVITDFDMKDHLENFGLETELIVPEPYDDMYIFWLDARIALMNNDMERYNQMTTVYNNAFLKYAQTYNRMFKPARTAPRVFRHEYL